MSARAEAAVTRADAGRERSWSPARVLSALALAAWAALFWFLIATDRTSLYLSSRTAWVVPMGAIVLTVAALGRIASSRVKEPEPMTRREIAGLALIMVPVVTVLSLPPGALGSFAASRRSSLTSGSFVSSAEDIASGELSLVDVSGATRSREAMRALVQRAGETVSFTGFVTRDGTTPPNEFVLTRFLISCCVADALSADVRVVGAPPGRFKEDQWVRVEGAMYPVGREVIVDATHVVGVERPKRPYLNP
ncbi:MAG: TIGR03943 family protein [Actinomycetota bacterium]|nr:TIGR03943 family protein [Actinomycetota bacterium]